MKVGCIVTGLVLSALAASPATALSTSSIPFAPNGDAIDGSSGAAVKLTSTSILVAAEGPDGVISTADDVVLLIEDVGGTPQITALPTPFLSDYSGGIEVLSPTRALVNGAGASAVWSNGDEVVFLLDQLGTANTVTAIDPGGALNDNSGYVASALSATTAVIATEGPDNTASNADDTVVLLTGLGTTNTVTPLAAPFLRTDGSVSPAVLSSTSFLISSNGPNSTPTNADDQVYLFTNVGGANTRTDLGIPNLAGRLPGRPVPLTATRALVGSEGANSSISNADDRVVLLDDLGGTNVVTSLAIPSLHDFGAGSPVRINDTTAVVSTEGANSISDDTDDSVWVLSDLGGTNTLTEVVVGALDEDVEARCVRLSDSSCALVSNGPDTNIETADDVIVTLSDIGGTNDVGFITVGGLAGQTTSALTAVSATSVLVATGGANSSIGDGNDDDVVWISDLFGTPTIDAVLTMGDLEGTGTAGHKPVVLSGALAVLLATGTNDAIGTGNDDLVQVIALGGSTPAPALSYAMLAVLAGGLFALTRVRLARRTADSQVVDG